MSGGMRREPASGSDAGRVADGQSGITRNRIRHEVVVVRVLVPRPLRMASPVAEGAITEAASGARRAVMGRVDARGRVNVKGAIGEMSRHFPAAAWGAPWNGPSVGCPWRFPISGEHTEQMREIACRVRETVPANPPAANVNLDRDEPAKSA